MEYIQDADLVKHCMTTEKTFS